MTSYNSIMSGCTMLACLLALACAESPNATTLDVERTTRGDTVIVRTLSGSVWDSAPSLVEEIRIGRLEGADEEMFGTVSALAPDGKGGVYVFDGRAPALRHYDATGTYTATFGGEGSGPGEYRDVALGLDVRPDGRVLMREPRNARINVYSPDGTPIDHWPVASGLFTSNAMVVDTAGELFLKTLVGRPERNRPWPIGLLHLGSAGELLDSISPPSFPGEPDSPEGVYGVSKLWEMSPLGYLVIGVNDQYAFELRKPDGSVVRIEKSIQPVEVNPEEKNEWRARNEWTRRNQGQFMTSEIPPVPDVKPAYKGFSIGGDGQIWVRLHVPSVRYDPGEPRALPGETPPPPLTWREPTVLDVFEPDGTYLGRVEMPERVSLWAHNGAEVWGVLRGESDELYVVRYRLDPSIRP